MGSLLFSGGFFILKAHGDIDDAASLVLTARDYRNIIHSNPAFDALFSALLMTRCLLFIGYSLADPDFRLLLDRQLSIFGENIPERYALMAGVGVVEADIMKRSANIKVLAYPAGQHSEVPLFLQGLLAQLEADSTRANTSLPSTDSLLFLPRKLFRFPSDGGQFGTDRRFCRAVWSRWWSGRPRPPAVAATERAAANRASQ